MYCGVVIEDGRIGYEYYPREETFNAFKTTFIRGVNTKVKFDNYKDFKDDLEKTLLV